MMLNGKNVERAVTDSLEVSWFLVFTSVHGCLWLPLGCALVLCCAGLVRGR